MLTSRCFAPEFGRGRRAASLTREQLRKLHVGAAGSVCAKPSRWAGRRLAIMSMPNGEEGFFQLQHRVYGREGEPCLVCGTPIKRVVIAGRSSHYCPHCQK